MMNLHCFLVLLVGSLSLGALIVVNAQNATEDNTLSTVINTSKNDPRTFFGGADNEEYLDWVDTTLSGSSNSNVSYTSALFLPNGVDANQGMAIHWSINEPGYINLALAVRATSWLGFGFSGNGGMTGSDILLYEQKNPNAILDTHVQGVRASPITDACQDWQLVSSLNGEEFLMIQVSRKLDTGDSQDIRILNDAGVAVPPHRVIASWGDQDEGVSYHGSQTARGAIRFFGGGANSDVIGAQTVSSSGGGSGAGGDEESMFMQAMARQSSGTFFVGPKENHNIKANDTEYALFCTNANDLRAMGVPLPGNGTNNTGEMSIIGFSPLIDNIEHVHHFIITASYAENNNVTTQEHCEASGRGLFDMLYAWAPGEPSLALPDNVGFTLGGPNGYNFFAIEIHYDNPQLKTGGVDKSGVQFYYSTEPREHSAGFLVLGDSLVALQGQSIARGLSDYDFYCPGECSALALSNGSNETSDDGTVTVIREYLHMHKSGTSSYNQHFRDGEVIRTGKAEYFDFVQQGAQVVQQAPFEIRPGDSFHTRCFYQNEEDGRVFGPGSSDEMCMAFLLYYPRKVIPDSGGAPWMCAIGATEFGLPDCEVSFTQDAYLDSLAEGEAEDNVQAAATAAMQRTFGMPSDRCLVKDDNVDAATGDNTPSIRGGESAAMRTNSAFGAGAWAVVLTLTYMMMHLA